MKLILEIQNRSSLFVGRDDYQLMVDTDGLSVVRENVTENTRYGWPDTIGYAVVIKNSNSGEVFYRREFKIEKEYKNHGVIVDKISIQQATEQCNKELDLTIQKIKDAINRAKKRHTDFTEPIKLIHYGE